MSLQVPNMETRKNKVDYKKLINPTKLPRAKKQCASTASDLFPFEIVASEWWRPSGKGALYWVWRRI